MDARDRTAALESFPNAMPKAISIGSAKSATGLLARQLWWGHRIPVWTRQTSFGWLPRQPRPQIIANLRRTEPPSSEKSK